MYSLLKSFPLPLQPSRPVSVATDAVSEVPTARLRLLGTALLLSACLGVAAVMPISTPKAGSAECPGHLDCDQHNMMIVGEQTIFLSHLPMFHGAHRFQVIVEAGFDEDGTPLDRMYAEDRRKHPDVRMYTLVPREHFVLSRLFSNDPETLLRSFPGRVFRGHFERDGTLLEPLANVEAVVHRVVYAEEIGLEVGPAGSDELDYILFGGEPELFLAHRITQPPDFDQLLGVKLSGHEFTDDDFARGVLITLRDRENSPARRLRMGETVSAQGRVAGTDIVMTVEVEVTTEYYFEESELDPQSLEPFGQTPLEEEAGF